MNLDLHVERVESWFSCQEELEAFEEGWFLKLGLAYLCMHLFVVWQMGHRPTLRFHILLPMHVVDALSCTICISDHCVSGSPIWATRESGKYSHCSISFSVISLNLFTCAALPVKVPLATSKPRPSMVLLAIA